MRVVYLVATAVVLLSAHTECNSAGLAANTTIDRMMMDENYGTKIYIKTAIPSNGGPACATQPTWDYVLDTGSQLGIQMYAILVSAHAKGTVLTLLGTHQCDVHATIETLRRIELL